MSTILLLIEADFSVESRTYRYRKHLRHFFPLVHPVLLPYQPGAIVSNWWCPHPRLYRSYHYHCPHHQMVHYRSQQEERRGGDSGQPRPGSSRSRGSSQGLAVPALEGITRCMYTAVCVTKRMTIIGSMKHGVRSRSLSLQNGVLVSRKGCFVQAEQRRCKNLCSHVMTRGGVPV